MTMNEMAGGSWETVIQEATRAPMEAEGRVSAEMLARAALGRRVEDSYDRALREAKQLVEDAERLVATLRRDGVGAAVSGNNFASQARTVSGALIRLAEARETFSCVEGYRRAERRQVVAAAPQLPAAQAPAAGGEEGEEEMEDEETEG